MGWVVLLTICLLPAVASAQRVISAGDYNAAAGDTVTVNVTVDDAAGVLGTRVWIEWDATAMTYVAGSAVQVSGCNPPAINVATAGRAIFTFACLQALPVGPATLISFQLAIDADAAGGVYDLAFEGEPFTRLNDGAIDSTTVDGTITVEGEEVPTATPTETEVPPTATPTETPVPPTATATATTVPCDFTECFNDLPLWSDTFDADWGGAAEWGIDERCDSNALVASRNTDGSSVVTQYFDVPAGCYDICVVMTTDDLYSPCFWMETGARAGQASADSFDQDAATWTLINKFDGDCGPFPNGSRECLTYCIEGFETDGGITIGYKLGLGGGGGATITVAWNDLNIVEVACEEEPTATPTETEVPPTATPTDTEVPATATPTETEVPPTATPTEEIPSDCVPVSFEVCEEPVELRFVRGGLQQDEGCECFTLSNDTGEPITSVTIDMLVECIDCWDIDVASDTCGISDVTFGASSLTVYFESPLAPGESCEITVCYVFNFEACEDFSQNCIGLFDGFSLTPHCDEVEDLCFPDVNEDCIVDVADLQIVVDNFGTDGSGETRGNPDANRDGTVDIFDLYCVSQNFGLEIDDCVPPVLTLSANAAAPALLFGYSYPAAPAVGDVFTYVVEALDASDLRGYQFDVVYNANALELLSAKVGDLLAQGNSGVFSQYDDGAAGVVENLVALRLQSSGVTADGVVAELVFKRTAAGNANISFDNVKFVDNDSNALPVEAEVGSID